MNDSPLPDLSEWLQHFRANAARAPGISVDGEAPLAEAERRRIRRSIAAFQLGEHSEGRSLMAFARDQAARAGRTELVEITRHFVREEQLHAAMLRDFMQHQGIPRLRRHWSDDVFRWLRRGRRSSGSSYELSISVLIVAELIALPYYRALREATSSRALRAICDRILDDERAHVDYESSVIRRLRAARPSWQRVCIGAAHRALYGGTLLVVWGGHRGVLGCQGGGLAAFWRSAWREYAGRFQVEETRDTLRDAA